jgi:hypothetical protein
MSELAQCVCGWSGDVDDLINGNCPNCNPEPGQPAAGQTIHQEEIWIYEREGLREYRLNRIAPEKKNDGWTEYRAFRPLQYENDQPPPQPERAERIVGKWPEWKKEVTLTEHSVKQPEHADSITMPRTLLGKIVDEVFHGAIEDSAVIEDIYRVIMRERGEAEPVATLDLKVFAEQGASVSAFAAAPGIANLDEGVYNLYTRAEPRAAVPATIDIDALAQEIRRVDGSHTLGASALAEKIAGFLCGQKPRAAVPPGHVANEWADMAVNGVQWLRNVRDGISSIDDALREMESNHARIQALAAAPSPDDAGGA